MARKRRVEDRGWGLAMRVRGKTYPFGCVRRRRRDSILAACRDMNQWRRARRRGTWACLRVRIIYELP